MFWDLKKIQVIKLEGFLFFFSSLCYSYPPIQSQKVQQSYITEMETEMGRQQTKHSPFDAVKSMATVKWIWVLK